MMKALRPCGMVTTYPVAVSVTRGRLPSTNATRTSMVGLLFVTSPNRRPRRLGRHQGFERVAGQAPAPDRAGQLELYSQFVGRAEISEVHQPRCSKATVEITKLIRAGTSTDGHVASSCEENRL